MTPHVFYSFSFSHTGRLIFPLLTDIPFYESPLNDPQFLSFAQEMHLYLDDSFDSRFLNATQTRITRVV